jgi:hypothetical protein
MLIWIPPVAAAVTVIVFLSLLAWQSESGDKNFPSEEWFKNPIHVDSSWDLADSWLTNASFFGNAASGILVAVGGLPNVVPPSDQAIVITMIVLFSAAALGAPIVFAALSAPPPRDTAPTPAVKGTNGGLFAAAGATLFAAFGGLAMTGLVAWSSTTSGLEKGIAVAGLILASIPIAIYAGRSLNEIATFQPGTPPASPPPDQPGPARARSLLQGTGRLSGTL